MLWLLWCCLHLSRFPLLPSALPLASPNRFSFPYSLTSLGALNLSLLQSIWVYAIVFSSFYLSSKSRTSRLSVYIALLFPQHLHVVLVVVSAVLGVHAKLSSLPSGLVPYTCGVVAFSSGQTRVLVERVSMRASVLLFVVSQLQPFSCGRSYRICFPLGVSKLRDCLPDSPRRQNFCNFGCP